MGSLRKKIADERFLRLIQAMLNAGYLEEWTYHKTYSGVPQGSIVSPVLANIYLHELDQFMSKMKEQFDQGKRRRTNNTYQRYTDTIRRLRQKWNVLKGKEEGKDKLQEIQREIKTFQAQRRHHPSGDPFDREYRRLYYCRYADDVRHLTQDEILLAEKGGTEEYGLRVISPTWSRKAKGKGACEKRGKRVKALMRCPARPA